MKRALLFLSALALPIMGMEVTPLLPTYLGNFQRNYYGNRAPQQLRVLWRTHLGTGKTFFKDRVNLMSGAGWTGQPLLFQENSKLVLIQGSLD